MAGETGLTAQTVRQVITSNPAEAQQLGAYFAAERTALRETKSIGTFTVDGRENGVEYGRLGSRDVGRNMAGNIDMVPGNTYTIEADGQIDKNGWWFGGDVGPNDRQQDRTGSRLQVAVVDADGNVIERHNYRPGMQIGTDREGARLGFVFADGDLSDNSGHFNVNVRETSTRAVETNVGIIAQDADGIDRAGRTIVDAFSSAPEAAYLPDPDRSLSGPLAERGLVVSRGDNEVQTTDGYRFQFRDNEVRIDWPGRHEDGSAETRIVGRQVVEGDGTEWNAQNGNYVLPNGAMFTLGYDDAGNINRFTLVHGDSLVDVDGIGDGDPRIGRVHDGGLDYRRRAVEDNFGGSTFRMGGLNDGWSELDVLWNLESRGQNLGRLEAPGFNDDGNWIRAGEPYVVDPELKPPFGTRDYERMLRSEIEDIRSAISGGAQEQGATRDVGRLIADYLLGQSGTYDQYAAELGASRNAGQIQDPAALYQQLLEQMWLQQMLGGMPEYHGNFDNGMSSIQQLYQMLAAQAGMQNDYNAASNNLRSFIPSYQGQQQIDPSMLVDQVLRGIGERRAQQQSPRSRLDRFDIGDRRARGTFDHDPRAALLRNRLEEGETRLSNPRETVDRLKDKLSYGAFDWAVTDEEAHSVIDELSRMTDRDLAQVAEHLGPDMVARLLDNLTDEDKSSYASTIDRLRDVGNVPRTTLDRSGEDAGTVAGELTDKLSYGAFDWAVTDGEARDVIDRLSRYPERDLRQIVDQMGPDMVSRLLDNLSDEDKTHYQGTIDRINAASNNRREDVTDMRGTVDDLRGKMEYGAFDWAVTDGEAREVIDRLSKMSPADLRQAVEHMGPEALTRLESNLTDADKERYGSTLERIRGARNQPREALADPDAVANDLRDKLSRGVFDWAVTDGDARHVLDQLSRLSERDIGRVLDRLGPDLTSRLLDNVSDADRAAYGSTIDRLDAARNQPREELRNARQVVEDIQSKLSYGAFDWAVTEEEARAVVSQLSRYEMGDLRRVVEMIDPSLLNRLEENLSDADKQSYRATLNRINRVR
jgi:Mg/Co/Ni transporter MgtE